MDETSGLFNRKYMNFYLEKAHKTNPRQLYGIMMDVNDFKKINDRYGHSMGDRAIREIGKILSASLPEDAVAIRMAGDEFIILLSRGNGKMLEDTRAAIEDGLRHFNQTTTAPFKLSFLWAWSGTMAAPPRVSSMSWIRKCTLRKRPIIRSIRGEPAAGKERSYAIPHPGRDF